MIGSPIAERTSATNLHLCLIPSASAGNTDGSSQKLTSGSSSESSFAYSVRIEPSRRPSSISSNHKGVSTRRFASTAAARMRGSFRMGIACILISSRSPSLLSKASTSRIFCSPLKSERPLTASKGLFSKNIRSPSACMTSSLLRKNR